MSTGWVVDSSVGFAWVHPHQATSGTTRLLHDSASAQKLVVPVLWFVEVANGLLVLQRRKKITAIERAQALDLLESLNLLVDDEAGRVAFRATSSLAEKHGLSVYDATYLEIALRRKLGLASRDEALNSAAKLCGLKTL